MASPTEGQLDDFLDLAVAQQPQDHLERSERRPLVVTSTISNRNGKAGSGASIDSAATDGSEAQSMGSGFRSSFGSSLGSSSRGRVVRASAPPRVKEHSKRKANSKSKIWRTLRRIAMLFPAPEAEQGYISFAAPRIGLLTANGFVGMVIKVILIRNNLDNTLVAVFDALHLANYLLCFILGLYLLVRKHTNEDWRVARLVELACLAMICTSVWSSGQSRTFLKECWDDLSYSISHRLRCIHTIPGTAVAYVYVLQVCPIRAAFAIPIIWVSPIVEVIYIWGGQNPKEVTTEMSIGRFLFFLVFTCTSTVIVVRREQMTRERFLIKSGCESLRNQLASMRSVVERTLQTAFAQPVNVITAFDGSPVEDYSELCTVGVASVEGFAQWSVQQRQGVVAAAVDQLGIAFDVERRRIGLEKVYASGDLYIVVAGLRSGLASPIEDELHDTSPSIAFALFQSDYARQQDIDLKIGIGTGSCNGAMVGKATKFYIIGGMALEEAKLVKSYSEKWEVLIPPTTLRWCVSDQIITEPTNSPILTRVVHIRRCDDDVAKFVQSGFSSPAEGNDGPTLSTFRQAFLVARKQELKSAEDVKVQVLQDQLTAVYESSCLLPAAHNREADEEKEIQDLAIKEHPTVVAIMFTLTVVLFVMAALEESLTLSGSLCFLLSALLSAITSHIPKAIAPKTNIIDVVTTVVQAIFCALGVAMMKLSTVNANTSYLLVLLCPVLIHASSGVSFLVITFAVVPFILVNFFGNLIINGWTPEIMDIALIVISSGIVFLVARTREVEFRAARAHVLITRATKQSIAAERELLAEVYELLLPQPYVEATVQRSLAPKYQPAMEAVEEMCVLALRFADNKEQKKGVPPSWIDVLQIALDDIPERVINVVKMQGDAIILAGPFCGARAQQVSSRMEISGSNEPKLATEGKYAAAIAAGKQLVGVLGTIMTGSSGSRAATAALVWGDGLVCVVGVDQPRLDVQGVVARTADAMVAAAADGMVCCNEAFVKNINEDAPSWKAAGLSVEKAPQPWRMTSVGQIRVQAIRKSS